MQKAQVISHCPCQGHEEMANEIISRLINVCTRKLLPQLPSCCSAPVCSSLLQSALYSPTNKDPKVSSHTSSIHYAHKVPRFGSCRPFFVSQCSHSSNTAYLSHQS